MTGLVVCLVGTGLFFSASSSAQTRTPMGRDRVWSVPEDRLADPAERNLLGRFEKNASGNYDIYDGKGNRVGVGRPRPDGSVDLFDPQGSRGIEVKPDKRRGR